MPSLYNAKGILLESQVTEDMDAAKAQALNDDALPDIIRKLLNLPRQWCVYQYHYGCGIANKAYQINDASSNLDNAAYNKMRGGAGASFVQRSCDLSEKKASSLIRISTHNALPILRNIYYNLNDAEKSQAYREHVIVLIYNTNISVIIWCYRKITPYYFL